MFVSKKDHDLLKHKVEQQDKLLQEMIYHVNELANQVNDLKQPKEPSYFK